MTDSSSRNGCLATRVIFSREARQELYEGLNIVAEAVATTLGPSGKTVLIQQSDHIPIVTKDGVSVAKAIKLRDPVKNMGAKLILEAATQTNEIAGDGTTTATVLTHSMVKEGLKLLEAGYSAKELCNAIELTRIFIDNALHKKAKQLTTSEEIAQVATISANGDKNIGELISTAMSRVGKDGIITVEDAKGTSTTLDLVEGMQFDRGYLSPYFVTNTDRMNVVYKDVVVLVTDKKLNNLHELIPILEKVVNAQKALLVIAEDVEGEALQGLVLNKTKSNLRVVAIKAPGYGIHQSELLNDICCLTGAKLVSSSAGLTLDKVTLKDLGTCKRIIVDAKSSTLVSSGTATEMIDKHVADLRMQLEDVTLNADQAYKLRSRIAKLASGVAVIRVGGATEIEMVERKYRVEDSLNATRSAVSEGIVAGGGMALVEALREFNNDPKSIRTIGSSIVTKACLAPIRKIIENAEASFDVVMNELDKNPGKGYNAVTGQYVDLISTGVIDPVLVTRTALKHAASVAMTFLSLDAVIVEEKYEE